MKRFAALCTLVMCVLLLTTGCAKKITKGDAYPDMYAETPTAILVLPPINESTAADAKEYYSTTIAEPLSIAGYYVYPLEVVTDILRNEGLGDTEMLFTVPPQKFRDYFGADAVLYIKILKWDTVYYVIGGYVTVSVEFLLKSTKTGKCLWKYDGTMQLDTTGDSQNTPGLAGVLLQVVTTAVKTAVTDYVPVARQANQLTLISIPYGRYHPQHGQDGNAKIVIEKKVKEKPKEN